LDGVKQACQLATALLERCIYFGDEADLLEAKALLDTVPSTDSGSQMAVALSLYHVTRWDALSQHDRLEIQRLKDSLVNQLQHEAPARRAPSILAACFSLCSIICYLRGHKGAENAISIAREAVNIQPNAFPLSDYLSAWAALSRFLGWLARGTRDWTHMELAKGLIERMMLLGETQSALNESKSHSSLGYWLIRKSRDFGDTNTNTFTRAISEFQNALRLLPLTHIHRRSYLSSLVFILGSQWLHSGRRSCLDETTKLADANPHQAKDIKFVVNVTHAMLVRAEAGRLRSTSIIILLERAIQMVRATLAIIPDRSGFKSCLLENLCWAFRLQIRHGLLIDKEEFLRTAAEIAPSTNGDPGPIASARVILVGALLDMAMSTRDLEVLNESFALVHELPHNSNSDESGVFYKARYHAVRYQLLGDPEDLISGKDALEAALTMEGSLVRQMRHLIACMSVAESLQDAYMPAYNSAITATGICWTGRRDSGASTAACGRAGLSSWTHFRSIWRHL
jgi:hypothetical protein